MSDAVMHVEGSGHGQPISACFEGVCIGIAVPLASIINLSLSSGVFPSEWKLAVIQPVSKRKGGPSNPHNYRPISLLICVAKIYESLVKKQLLSFCFANDIMPDEHFGFLPKR